MNHIGEFLYAISEMPRTEQRNCAMALLLSLYDEPDNRTRFTVFDVIKASGLAARSLLQLKILADANQLREYLKFNEFPLTFEQAQLLSADPLRTAFMERMPSGSKPYLLVDDEGPIVTYAQGLFLLGIEERIQIPPELLEIIGRGEDEFRIQ